MRELLDTPLLRLVKIMEILIYSDDWVTMRQIAKEIGYTEKTVSKDINLLKKRWGKLLDLEVSSKLGVKVHNQNVAVMGRVFNDLFNESIALKWLEEIFLYPRKNMEFFEARLFTSQSTLNRLLPRLNSTLSKMKISLLSRKKQLYIHSENEIFVRKFYATFFIELYGVNLEHFPFKFNLETLNNIICEDVLDDFQMGDDVSITFLSIFYIVSLMRESQGFHIASCSDLYTKISDRHFSYITSIFPDIKKENLSEIHNFIIKQFLDGWDSPKEKELVYAESEKLFRNIFKKLRLEPPKVVKNQMYEMIKRLFFSYKLYPFELSILFDRIKYFSLSFYKTNPELFRYFDQQLKIFSANIGYGMDSYIHYFIYWMHMIYPDLKDHSIVKTILVVSDFGQEHAEFIGHRLSSTYSNELDFSMNIDALSYANFAEQGIQKNYDIIATTIPDLPIEHHNIVLIDDYPSIENFCQIFNKLYKVQEG